jgi:tRNA A-37 threonylcarbamoyl transferase component Bud32
MADDVQSSQPAPEKSAPDASARLLAGRYRLKQVLGKGGMGTVWRAEDEMLGRPVAVKELRLAAAMDEDEARRLVVRTLREAKATARIRHTGAVTVFDVVEEDDRPWIVMELVESRSLAEVIKQDGTLSVRRAAEIGLEVLGVLGAAHRHGVLHRDVKPSNVLVGEDGRVVLTDFGIASVEGDPSITSTGMLVGAPSYISPERAQGHKPGPPADLWSLGVTLYAMIEGKPPYDKGSALSTLTAVMTEPLVPPKNGGALVPVIEGLLRKDPAERLTEAEARRMLRQIVDAPEPAEVPAEAAAAEAVTAPLPEPAVTRRQPKAAVAQTKAEPAAPKVQLGKVRIGARIPAPRKEQPAPAAAAEPVSSPAAGGGSRNRVLAAVGVLVVLAVVGVLVGKLASGDGSTQQDLSGAGHATHSATAGAGFGGASPSPRASGTPSASASASSSASAPSTAGYTTYSGNGFSILIPPGFTQISDTLKDNSSASSIAWQDAQGDLLQVDWQTGAHQSALDTWNATSQGWSGTASNTSVTATKFKGWDAANWEWQYGLPVKHVLDVGFTPDSSHWFAIAWRTAATNWGATAQMRSVVTNSFAFTG